MTNASLLIQRHQPSSASLIWEAQAKLTAWVIQEAEEAIGAISCDDSGEPYQWEVIGPSLFDEYEYQRLIQTVYACGWVCNDLPLHDFLPQVNRDVAGTVGVWAFPQLRLYLHTLMRGEKWCDGDSSVVLDAFASGALHTVADRLQNDQSLYEPL